jgi:predicted neuraminidase
MPKISVATGAADAPRAASRLILLGLGIALVATGLAELRRWQASGSDTRSPAQVQHASASNLTLTKLSEELIPMPAGVPSAHASTLAALPGNSLLAFWWAGSRESGPDVKVYTSRLTGGKWSASREVASRETLGAALGFGVRRIGNPVAWTDRNGKVHLYVVATGLGGWAASRIVHLVSTDLGEHFGVLRVLPMSPMFNSSALIRTTPVALADGGWWLPVYFELGVKYPMLMAFDERGDPRWIARIGKRTASLQPAVVATTGTEAHAWMRDASNDHKVQHAVSHDAGASWQDQAPLDVANYNSSVAAYRLSNGATLMLRNYVPKGGEARNVLRLSLSNDARSWKDLLDVVKGNADEEFSYPALQQVGDEVHITYTSRRQAIAHHVYRINYGADL